MPSFKEIPLAQLNPSPLNVRSDPSDDEIEALAESIAAKGILQPLLVRPAGKEHYEVVAGERRRRALRLLADQGRIDAGAYKVPCNVRKGSDADGREDSLTENVMRRAMLGSVSQLSCWVRMAVTVMGDVYGAYRGRQVDVRVKRSRSVARTTLEAAATPQAF